MAEETGNTDQTEVRMMKRPEYCPYCGEKFIMPNVDGTYDCYKCNSRFTVVEGKWEDTRTEEEKINDMFDL